MMAYKISKNEVTGDTIQTGKGSQELFSEGWNRVFSKKQKELLDEPLKFVVAGGAYKNDWLCKIYTKESEQFKAAQLSVLTKLDEPSCKLCRGTEGAYDCGWWYECPSCTVNPLCIPDKFSLELWVNSEPLSVGLGEKIKGVLTYPDTVTPKDVKDWSEVNRQKLKKVFRELFGEGEATPPSTNTDRS
jgi:hypothetical protein